MSIIDKKKKEIIEKFRLHEGDTGSTDVQIAILTAKINHLVEHLKLNKKDHTSRHGLLVMVGKRKGLLKYLEGSNSDKYTSLTKSLGLR